MFHFLAALSALYLSLVTEWVSECHFRILTQRVTFETSEQENNDNEDNKDNDNKENENKDNDNEDNDNEDNNNDRQNNDNKDKDNEDNNNEDNDEAYDNVGNKGWGHFAIDAIPHSMDTPRQQ